MIEVGDRVRRLMGFAFSVEISAPGLSQFHGGFLVVEFEMGWDRDRWGGNGVAGPANVVERVLCFKRLKQMVMNHR